MDSGYKREYIRIESEEHLLKVIAHLTLLGFTYYDPVVLIHKSPLPAYTLHREKGNLNECFVIFTSVKGTFTAYPEFVSDYEEFFDSLGYNKLEVKP